MQRKQRTRNEILEHEYAEGDAGASLSYPVQCSSLRKGGYVNIKDRPCKVMDLFTSKVGKHGHAKVCIVGIDLFTQKRYEEIHPSSHNVDVPNIQKTEYVLVDAGATFMSLMDEKGLLRYDVRVPENEHGRIIRGKLDENIDETVLITVLSAMGQDAVIGVKTAKD